MKISALLFGLLFSSLSLAQTAYPNKPIKLIVPLAAGSAVDNAARIVMQKVGDNLKQSIVIENVLGAAGAIGADRVAKSAPDGYTLGGYNDSIMTMIPHMKTQTWDILKDFEPISLIATVEWGLVVNVDSNIKTAADFIAAAKRDAGKLNYGSGGNGSPQHIAMALFANQAGISLTHVPYKGATQAAVGVAGKEVDAAFQGIATVNSLVQAGKLRLIAVSTPRRLAQFPNVPTVNESGLAGFEFNSWFAMMAPAGTPKAITEQLHKEVAKALGDSEVQNKLMLQGLTPRGLAPDELGKAMRAQYAKYGKLIKDAGIKSE